MAQSSRFAVAVHIMALLAWIGDEPAKSEYLATSASTNPVVVRRLLGALASARLVVSHTGSAGGSRLARSPESISLLEIYRAVDHGRIFALHHQPPSATCPVGKDIQPVLTGILDRAEGAMDAELAHTTLAAVVQQIRAPSREAYRSWQREAPILNATCAD